MYEQKGGARIYIYNIFVSMDIEKKTEKGTRVPRSIVLPWERISVLLFQCQV